MARRSKEERKKAIDDTFLADVPPFGIPGASIFLAVKLAKLMIDHEENMGFAPDLRQLSAAEQRLLQALPGAPAEPLLRTEVIEEKPKRKKRKVSDYSKQFGIILKALKKKHPRTPVTRLMKRAHTATKKKMPKKKAPKKGKSSKGRRTIARSGQFRRDKILPRRK